MIIDQWIANVFVANHIEEPRLAAGRVGAPTGFAQHGVRLRVGGNVGDRRTSGFRAIPGLLLPSESIATRRTACCNSLVLPASRLGR